MVTRETINGVLDTASATVATTTIKASTEVKPDGDPIRETKRRVKLKTEKQLHQEEKAKEKGRLGGLSEVEFTKNLDDASTVEFTPFAEGPPREPQPVYPPDIDCDSPYALFSLFWDEKMWQILATNTNQYAIRQGAVPRGRTSGARSHSDIDSLNQRTWWATNPDELKVFVGTLIYIGIHPEGETAEYWNKDLLNGPNHTPALWITLERFTQLQRFLHCSPVKDNEEPPLSDQLDRMTASERRETNQQWWRKLEPIISMFRSNCSSHWIPGKNVSIDEMMIKFYGRSKHTLKMVNKPIKQGFKMWALCDRGYLFYFMFHSRFFKIGELKKHVLLTDTQSIVYQLAVELPPLPDGQTYTIYLDNLFTSTQLFRELKVVGIGACGTTRANSSPDFPNMLHLLKEKYGHVLPWGTLVAIPVDEVLCLGWIDNNTVLSLSTVHTVNKVADHVKRWRRRPQQTSSNATNARKPFNGKGPRAELAIPRYIDEYNFNMGGVDIADQHRAAYKTQRKVIRNWLPH